MKRLLLLFFSLLLTMSAFSQNMAGKWLVYEGNEGTELVVTITPKGGGHAEFSFVRRMEAVSYGEGSQFWGTFRATGGYYFLVKGVKSEAFQLKQIDSTLVITRREEPSLSVTAWLDEPYSTRELSDYGDYKKQVVAQWKRDFLTNEDVKKYKLIMEHYFTDYYDDAFEVLLEGKYRIVEHTDSTMVLKNMELEIPLRTWKRILLLQ